MYRYDVILDSQCGCIIESEYGAETMFKKFGENELEANISTERTIKKSLRCAFCSAAITDADEKIHRQGAHAHVCTNPLGQTYRIGCFQEAPGCMSVGTPTGEHTWFSGHLWTIALCRKCRDHLGWQFKSNAGSFYGLILDKLIEQ